MALTAAHAATALSIPGASMFDEPVIVVIDDHATDLDPLAAIPVVVIAVSEHAPDWADVVVASESAASPLVAAVIANPDAALVLMQQLRLAAALTPTDALVAESLAYATLQHGAEFERWLEQRGRRVRPAFSEPAVLIRDDDDMVTLTLNRPRLRNALTAEMRDAWVEALRPLALRPDTAVHIEANGPAFCVGGDLAEFGTTTDAAAAHRIRMAANVAPVLLAVVDRCTVDVHGACIGAGLELAAFAGTVRATPDATFALPEVAMGLIPGAGGTVSIPERIGRHAAAELALSGRRIDAAEALRLGLIDEIRPET